MKLKLQKLKSYEDLGIHIISCPRLDGRLCTVLRPTSKEQVLAKGKIPDDDVLLRIAQAYPDSCLYIGDEGYAFLTEEVPEYLAHNTPPDLGKGAVLVKLDAHNYELYLDCESQKPLKYARRGKFLKS